MRPDYLQGYILGVTANAGEVVLRLDQDESEAATDPENPVLNMRLKGCPRSEEVCRELAKYIHEWAEIFFQEEGVGKYLEFYIDYAADADPRLNYAECEVTHEVYTTEDLRGKLKHLRQRCESQIDCYEKETTKLRAVINGLRQELAKELDRFERKSEFFASTDKAGRFEMGRNCYQRALELLDRLQKNEAV